jgi:haloalkane dehalogenase
MTNLAVEECDMLDREVGHDEHLPRGAQDMSYTAKKTAVVNGRKMAYVEVGDGDPIVFQHGNPTSSYLWRDVMPRVAGLGRLIACDLIGMGDSDKLERSGPERYTYQEQREYLFELWEQLGLGEKVVLVLHDWGSALGFDWASQHPDRVAGIVYMEAIVQPSTWEDWPAEVRGVFQALRSSAGEDMVLDQNLFVESVFPNAILRDLAEEEMAAYRAPFREPGEGRRPTLSWPRQLPINGEPSDVVKIVQDYGAWLSTSSVPKLFINADPGVLLTGRAREFCRSWPNQQEITVPGLHFIQEDSPDEIGTAIADFVRTLRAADGK